MSSTRTRESESERRRQSSRRRKFCWQTTVLVAWVLAATVPLAQSYTIHVPKVARPQLFSLSRTRLSGKKKDSIQPEQSFMSRPPSKRKSSSKVAMTSALIDHTLPATPTFEKRMRDMVLTRPGKKRQQQRTSRLPRNVRVVETLQQYREIVGEERERIVVARFYAPWCKACKAIQPVFYRLANTFSNVVFVEVPVTDENATLHQGLGVPSLPFGHIYHPSGGLVEELSITRKAISQFGHKLQTYVSGRCDLKDMSPTSPYPPPSIASDEPSATFNTYRHPL